MYPLHCPFANGGGLWNDVYGYEQSGAFKFDVLANGPSEGDYSPIGAYAQSKLANIYFTREICRRESANGITAYAVHPGTLILLRSNQRIPHHSSSSSTRT
jgi:NAD(P)-dependent dehydrogenase (short-subunit alcohol dehydrogenase family)